MNSDCDVKHSALMEDLMLHKISIKENWSSVKKTFNTLYPNFFIHYLKEGIQLSATEERYLVLEKIGLKTQNIALLLQVQTESVYTMRYRLRKKLHIKM